MTTYPSSYQLNDNHNLFRDSARHVIPSSIEQHREALPHEAGSVQSVPRSTSRYQYPHADMPPPQDKLICRTAMSDAREHYDDSDEGYGLHYNYGKIWDSRPSEPIDTPVSAWTRTPIMRIPSAMEWSADTRQRTLPFNQTPLHRPPELYESSICEAFMLGVSGQRSAGTVTGSPPFLQSPNESVKLATDYPMSRLSRVPTQDTVPLIYHKVDALRSRLVDCPRVPDSIFQQVLFHEPTEEELEGAAHQPIPPEKVSTYSELSPHIEYMQRLKLEEALEKDKLSRNLVHDGSKNIFSSSVISNDTRPKAAAAIINASNATGVTNGIRTFAMQPHGALNTNSAHHPPTTTPAPLPESSSGLDLLAKKRKRSNQIPGHSTNPPVVGEMHVGHIPSVPVNQTKPYELGNSSTAVATSSTEYPTNEIKYIKVDPRKPSLACTFCRERKISCGRPPAGSPDQTCNQCARRSFKCEYTNDLPTPNSKNTTRRRRRSSLVATSPPN